MDARTVVGFSGKRSRHVEIEMDPRRRYRRGGLDDPGTGGCEDEHPRAPSPCLKVSQRFCAQDEQTPQHICQAFEHDAQAQREIDAQREKVARLACEASFAELQAREASHAQQPRDPAAEIHVIEIEKNFGNTREGRHELALLFFANFISILDLFA